MTGVLFIVFLVLKLTGHIDWNWGLVCLPLMAEFALRFWSHIFGEDKI